MTELKADLSGLPEDEQTFGRAVTEVELQSLTERGHDVMHKAIRSLVRLLAEAQALLRPELPKGWQLEGYLIAANPWQVRLIRRQRGYIERVVGTGPTLGAALTDVIAKAKEAGNG